MKKKILQCSVLIFIIPLATILCFSSLWHSAHARMAVLASGLLIQLFAVTFCKRKFKTLFKPTLNIAENMGIERIAVPYEPGKYKMDLSITNAGIYLSLPAPVFAYCAKLHPKEVVVPVLNFVSCKTANLDLLLLSFALMLIGALSLAIWSKLGQAVVIANEPGEKNRYLLRGFAEAVDNDSYYFCYNILSKIK